MGATADVVAKPMSYNPAFTTEYVYRGKGDQWPNTAMGFVAFLNEQVASIPEQYRGSAAISFGTDSEYDCYWATMEISYQRPTTDTDRQKWADQREQYRKDEIARLEAQLKRLK